MLLSLLLKSHLLKENILYISTVQPDRKRPILTPDSKEVQTRIFVDQIHGLGAEVKELKSANQALMHTTENENLKKQLDLLNLKVAKMASCGCGLSAPLSSKFFISVSESTSS